MGKPAICSLRTFSFSVKELAGEGLCSLVKEIFDIHQPHKRKHNTHRWNVFTTGRCTDYCCWLKGYCACMGSSPLLSNILEHSIYTLLWRDHCNPQYVPVGTRHPAYRKGKNVRALQSESWKHSTKARRQIKTFLYQTIYLTIYWLMTYENILKYIIKIPCLYALSPKEMSTK